MDNTKYIESRLDSLWRNVIEYRSSKHFKDVYDACVKFRNLAPYNAMLVEMQRPGASYLLTEQLWKKKYGRVIKPNARPLIILVPFGPVDFVFEISDTLQKERNGTCIGPSDSDILNEIAEPFKVKHNVPRKTLDTLIHNLAFHGIGIDTKMVAGVDFGAKIELLHKRCEDVLVPLTNGQSLRWSPSYLLSVNQNARDGELFASICHELGHLFCHHLPMPADWKEKPWKTRNIGHKYMEFEAESVAWLVCERLGIKNPSEKYLAGYFSENSYEAISHDISIERILSATKEIEAMLKPIKYKNGLLYKHCKYFKDISKDVIKHKQ